MSKALQRLRSEAMVFVEDLAVPANMIFDTSTTHIVAKERQTRKRVYDAPSVQSPVAPTPACPRAPEDIDTERPAKRLSPTSELSHGIRRITVSDGIKSYYCKDTGMQVYECEVLNPEPCDDDDDDSATSTTDDGDCDGPSTALATTCDASDDSDGPSATVTRDSARHYDLLSVTRFHRPRCEPLARATGSVLRLTEEKLLRHRLYTALRDLSEPQRALFISSVEKMNPKWIHLWAGVKRVCISTLNLEDLTRLCTLYNTTINIASLETKEKRMRKRLYSALNDLTTAKYAEFMDVVEKVHPELVQQRPTGKRTYVWTLNVDQITSICELYNKFNEK